MTEEELQCLRQAAQQFEASRMKKNLDTSFRQEHIVRRRHQEPEDTIGVHGSESGPASLFTEAHVKDLPSTPRSLTSTISSPCPEKGSGNSSTAIAGSNRLVSESRIDVLLRHSVKYHHDTKTATLFPKSEQDPLSSALEEALSENGENLSKVSRQWFAL